MRKSREEANGGAEASPKQLQEKFLVYELRKQLAKLLPKTEL
jgi:hypothetical protein